MAFLNKLNDLAKNIGDKTSDAIETTKLNSRINSERNAAGEELKKIGQYYYDRFIAGGETEPEVLAFCQAAKAHYDAAAEAQTEIERIRTQGETARTAASAPAATAAPQTIYCTGCGTPLPAGTRFCNNCGQRLDS